MKFTSKSFFSWHRHQISTSQASFLGSSAIINNTFSTTSAIKARGIYPDQKGKAQAPCSMELKQEKKCEGVLCVPGQPVFKGWE